MIYLMHILVSLQVIIMTYFVAYINAFRLSDFHYYLLFSVKMVQAALDPTIYLDGSLV